MDVWGPEVSSLDISGGSKRRPSGESDFLFWEISHELKKQDRLSFHFEAGSKSSPQGTRFNPDAPPQKEVKLDPNFPTTETNPKDLEAYPAINTDIVWSLSLNGAPSVKVKPDTERQHLMLQMIWNEDNHPETLSLSLFKKSLREIMDDSDGEVIFSEAIPVGSAIDMIIGD
ncbi:MAG: hypothetical protein C4516_00140 [Oxalobacter sp.]|nr:MAG: hypothetical protein C4516_00140 [Oxalobacter sp.]